MGDAKRAVGFCQAQSQPKLRRRIENFDSPMKMILRHLTRYGR